MSKIRKTNPPRVNPNGFIPTHLVHSTPDWVVEIAARYHGNGDLIRSIGDRTFHVLYVDETFSSGGSIPPGDWIIRYEYDETNGCHDHLLYVACKLS